MPPWRRTRTRTGSGARAEARDEDAPLHPVIAELQELIDTDPVVRMDVTQMIEQGPAGERYSERHVQDVPSCCA